MCALAAGHISWQISFECCIEVHYRPTLIYTHMILVMLLLVFTIVRGTGGDLYIILLFEGRGGGGGEVLCSSFKQKDDTKIAASAGGYIRIARQWRFLVYLNSEYFTLMMLDVSFIFNPILTGLFESKFLLGGGGVNLTPPSDLGPKGADRRKILHGCQDTCKEYCYNLFLAKNCLFIMLLWFMQIRCIIITYLLIFPTNRISEGQFLAESYVQAL